MQETWKPVSEFPDHYEVSNFGRVRSLTRFSPGRWPGYAIRRPGRVLQQAPTGTNYRNDRAYLSVMICVENQRYRRLVHRLVLIAFDGPPPNDHVCNHKDGNQSNNHISNLEWVTQQGNVDHARDVLGRQIGPVSRLSPQQIEEIISLRASGELCKDIAPKFGITLSYADKITRHLRTPRTRLTDNDIKTIRSLRASGTTINSIKKRFRIGFAKISRIADGRSHID